MSPSDIIQCKRSLANLDVSALLFLMEFFARQAEDDDSLEAFIFFLQFIKEFPANDLL